LYYRLKSPGNNFTPWSSNISHQEFFYPESTSQGFTHIDGTVAFYSRVNALITSTSVIVDYGCGRGAYGTDPVAYRRDLRILRGKAGKVIGLDVSLAGRDNPYLDEFRPVENDCWLVDAASVDLVLCDNVLEHLPEPDRFFTEAQRVLKPGGSLCIRTPNAWNYIALISRLVPGRAHAAILGGVKPGLAEKDVFPTLYRCNTLPALRKMLTKHGFTGAVYGYEAEPSYLSFSRVAYALGVLHQKLAPGYLRASIFAFAIQ
jgi:SAM-dependent methyltransferase